MVKAVKTIKVYSVYHSDSDEYFTLELEIDHENYEEELVSVQDAYGNDVEDDELFDEICEIFEDSINSNGYNE